ncbi:MAG: AAA family ATPase [Pseudomonadota bacterium]
MIKLQQLELTDFRPFKTLNIQFGEQLTVLVGINGAGKTSILEALAIMLSRLFSRIRSTKGSGQFFTDSDIRKAASETVNSIEIEFNQKSVSWQMVKTKRGRKKQTISNLTAIKDIVEQLYEYFEQNEKNSVPLAVFYGVNRAVLDVPLRIRTKHNFEQLSAYEQALTGGRNDFRRFFEWYRGREDFENEQKLYPIEPQSVGSNLQYQEPQLKAVRKAILALTGFSNLRVRRAPLRMEVKKAHQHFDVNQLSDGEKCLLALVGDLAHRLAIANPDLSNPLEGQAIVLIDEVELHLHPEWQHRVIPKLLETFPNCQFVLTTHSPLVLSHVRCQNIWCLLQSEQGMEAVQPDGTYGPMPLS